MTHSLEPINPIIRHEDCTDSSTYGLTKREYFAAMALQGLLSNSNDRLVSADDGTIAMTAIDAADALINALNK